MSTTTPPQYREPAERVGPVPVALAVPGLLALLALVVQLARYV